MPEKEPLQGLRALELVFEAESVIGVELFEEVEEFGGGFEDGEGRGVGAVEEDGDAAVGVEAEEPGFLLHVGGDVAIEGWVSQAVGGWEGVECVRECD